MNKNQIEKIVKEIVSKQLVVTTVESEKTFADMGADSLDKIDITIEIENKIDIDITVKECLKWNTVEDVINHIHKVIND